MSSGSPVAFAPCFHGPLVLYEYTEEHWFLERELSYTTLVLGFPWKITVPAMSFPTDLASIPAVVRPLYRKFTAGAEAVIHDWLTYRNPYVNKRGLDSIYRYQADLIMLEGMAVKNRPKLTAYTIYAGISVFSQFRRA